MSVAHCTKLLLLVGVILSNFGPFPRNANAWSESGHHLVALLAFDQFTPREQHELLVILASHPRYAEDFTPPVKIQSANRFRVGTAGYWPDIARNQPKYNRPTWHYQLGATLTLGDPSQFHVPETPGPLPPNSTLDTQELYIAQALELCRGVFEDRKAAPGDRSIALCWLAHLVGDAHQPCHAGSLYAADLFPDGDRGANSIPTRQKNNMHALWDGLLGGNYDEGAIRRRVDSISSKPEYQAIGQAALDTPNALDALTWLAESRTASREYTYTREVVGPLKAMIGEEGPLPEIYLSETYLRQAGNLAQLRAVQAGYRLAAIWQECLKSAEDAKIQD